MQADASFTPPWGKKQVFCVEEKMAQMQVVCKNMPGIHLQTRRQMPLFGRVGSEEWFDEEGTIP